MYDPALPSILPTLGPSVFPKKLALELTAHCNLRCSMCHHPNMRRPKGRLPFALWQRCADETAAVAPGIEVWFSFCGEPLLEPDLLLKMLDYGESVGLKSLNLNTNGMLLTPAVSDRLVASPVSLIVIGVDAFKASTYAQIRIDGNRDELYRNVEYLLQARDRENPELEIQVQFIEMPLNAGEMAPFSDYWLQRGATVKRRNMLSWGGQMTTPMDIAREERIPCPWAITMMHVFWDGRVPRCPGDTEGAESAGNAWDESLTVLWRRLGNYRQLHLQRNFDALPERCHTCKDWMVGVAERVRPTAARQLRKVLGQS